MRFTNIVRKHLEKYIEMKKAGEEQRKRAEKAGLAGSARSLRRANNNGNKQETSSTGLGSKVMEPPLMASDGAGCRSPYDNG